MKIKYFIAYLALIICITTGCIPELFIEEVDCSECYVPRPEQSELIVTVSFDERNTLIPIVVYKGFLEDRDTIAVDTLTQREGYVMVPVDQYYTVAAEYQTSYGVVYAIDGDELKTIKITGQCDEICWIIRGGIYDVTLKYD